MTNLSDLAAARRRLWRAAALLFAGTALLTAVFAQLWIPLGNPIPGEFSDSVDYLVFADYFRGAFSGQLTPALSAFFSTTRFPPLYPLALSAIGAGAGAVAPAYWLTAFAIIAGFALLALWLSRETQSTAAGLLLAATITLNAALFLLTLNPTSEPLFLLLTSIVLLWSRRIEDGRGSLIAFAAFVGVLPLARMAGMAIVVATALWIMLRRLRGRVERVVAVAIMAFPAAAWMVYRRPFQVAENYADALTIERALTAFGGWHGLLLDQPARIAQEYIDSFSPWLRAPAPAVIVIALLLVAGLLLRLKRGALDALMLVLYLALVWCWPYPAELARLLVVTLPLFALCVWESARWLVDRWPAMQATAPLAAATIIGAGAFALAIPFVVDAAQRATAPVDADLERFKRSASFFRHPSRAAALELLEIDARVASVMDTTTSIVGPADCVFTFYRNAYFIHAPQVHTKQMPYPLREDTMVAEQFSACRYVLISYQTSAQDETPPLYPMSELHDWKPVLLSKMSFQGTRVVAAALLRRTDAAVTTAEK